MAYLIMVRHGLTDWNAQGRWHGLTDIPLNEEGKNQASEAANLLKGIKIDFIYTSVLSRVVQTADEICKTLNLVCPITKNTSLNERDYGVYTGKNKWEVKKELGDEKFLNLRRSWNQVIPEGESLKDVYSRVVPFYKQNILSGIKSGRNILVVSSGNTLRALTKYIENISNEDIAKMELNFGEIILYDIDKNGKIISKKSLNANLYKGKY